MKKRQETQGSCGIPAAGELGELVWGPKLMSKSQAQSETEHCRDNCHSSHSIHPHCLCVPLVRLEPRAGSELRGQRAHEHFPEHPQDSNRVELISTGGRWPGSENDSTLEASGTTQAKLDAVSMVCTPIFTSTHVCVCGAAYVLCM